MEFKLCKRCDVVRSILSFREDDRYRDGRASWCRECHKARNSEWAKENRARLTKKAAQWRNNNEDAWRATYREHHNRNKDKRAAEHAAWAKGNRHKKRAIDAKRRAAKLQACPTWVDMKAIQFIYRRATQVQKRTGQRMHVDHIVPLQHPKVCGLHVPWNLQVIHGSENESKRNKWPYKAAMKQPDLFIEQPKPKAEQLQMSLA